MDKVKDRVLRQLNDALEKYGTVQRRLDSQAQEDVPDAELIEVHTLLRAAIDSISPRDSQYRRRADQAAADGAVSWQVSQLAGVVQALRTACWGGYLGDVAELIQADLFDDLLEMAEHLLESGYKDPAAVISGGVLEEHLRKTCQRRNIEVATQGRPKAAARLNDELAEDGAYTKLDAKSVTAWIALRNCAAHGKYAEYSKEQAKLMIQGLRYFTARRS